MKQKILIIGATGKTGMPITEKALEAGLDVRAVIRIEDTRSEKLRQLGAETVIGDVHDMQSVRQLMKGVTALYLSYPTHEQRLVEVTANVAKAAQDEGVQTIVNMSQLVSREAARSALTHQHWISENILDWSGVGTIHIRPSYFMENLLLFNSRHIINAGKIYLPYGSSRHAPVATNDIARTVVALLINPKGHHGKRYHLTGPENLTIEEMAHTIGSILQKDVEYIDLPLDHWRTALLEQAGLPKFLVDHLCNVAIDHQEARFSEQTDTIAALTGQTPQSLSDFVLANEASFTGKRPVSLGL